MKIRTLIVLLQTILMLCSCASTGVEKQDSLEPTQVATDQPRAQISFPVSNAAAEGVSPITLEKLNQLVQSFVDDEEIVGGELLVIKNGKTIFNEAYGWRDRDTEAPMETGGVYCVRSMTKPVVAAAILMLADDNLLDLEDHVFDYLPSFDKEGIRDITIKHLLQQDRKSVV